MPELHDLLERRAADYEPPYDLLTRVHERSRRRARTRLAATALVALATAVAAVGLSRVLPGPGTIFVDPPLIPLVGTWVSTDLDGSSQTMDIRPVGGVNFEVVLVDDVASVCAGAPATMTGTGRLDGAVMVIPTPMLQCDDGSTPVRLGGSSLEDALAHYTLAHDAATDTLTDHLGLTWRRSTATPDPGTTEAPISGGMWPQSDLDEVREAQEQADAGDTRYTWQVAPQIVDSNRRPGDAEIFARFLRERLGWEAFRWGDTLPNQYYGGECPQECHSYRVAFVRCGAGENPLYPRDRIHGDVSGVTDGTTCAPTIGEFTYEAVTVAVEQPLRRGPTGIWVVSNSYPSPRMLQTEPPSDAQVADMLDAFLQARVDGEGAEEQLDGSATDVPLLYAASNDAPYERFEYDLRGPVWPVGSFDVTVRLFADGRDTVVEQLFGLHGAEADRLELTYVQETTTENGAAAPELYGILDGQVTFSIQAYWEEAFFGPDGADHTSFYLNDEYEQLFSVVGDPLPPAGTCGVADEPASADELVASIRSSPNLSVTAPVATRVGAIDAVQLDVTSTDQGATCQHGDPSRPAGGPIMSARPDEGETPRWFAVGPDDRARLYVFEVPGNPVRTVAILISAPEPAFEEVLVAAAPILESFELDTEP